MISERKYVPACRILFASDRDSERIAIPFVERIL
jgi:hypothetical protein